MPISPRESAGIFEILFFSWINKLLAIGSKRDLDLDDIYDILPEDRSESLGDQLQKQWRRELRKCNFSGKTARKSETSRLVPPNDFPKRPKLLRALLRVFGWQFLGLGVIAIINECCIKILQPLLLGCLIRYFGGEFGPINGYIFATGVILCTAWYVIQQHPYFFGLQHIAMRSRVAVSSLVYRKALKLSMSALRETTIGQMVNFLSNDVSRFDQAPLMMWYLIAGPLQLGIATYILWGYYSYTCLVGVLFLILFVPLQSVMGHLFAKLRREVAGKTDKRIRIMNEMITAIKVIKMYTWEEPFAKLAQESREYEVKSLRKVANLKAVNFSLYNVSSRIVIFLTLLTHVLLGNYLKPDEVFVTLALYNNVRLVLTLWFPYGMSFLAEILVSIRRLEDFLLLEDRSDTSLRSIMYSKASGSDKTSTGKEKRNKGITARNIYAKWCGSQTEWTLENFTLEVKMGQLVAVIGPVGSSKSSLLQVILTELPITSGLLEVRYRIAYAAQEPWIFSGTVRENILFGRKLEPHWYKYVLEACALKRDLEILPYGDCSLVGDRGISLSGGQKARINLARAVYSDADVYLLDDPLSAVDTEVGKHLFDKCIRGILRRKAVILVTHQLQFVKAADEVVLLNAGKTEIQGTWNKLQTSGINFASLLPQNEIQPQEHGARSGRNSAELRRSPSDPGVSSRLLSVEHSIPTDYGTRLVEFEDELESPLSLTLSESRTSKTLQLVTNLGNNGDKKYGTFRSQNTSNGVQPQEISEESRSIGEISLGLYWKFLRAGSGWGSFCILLVTACLTQFLLTGSDYWLQFWTRIEDGSFTSTNSTSTASEHSSLYQLIVEDRDIQIWIYCAIIILLLFVSLTRTLTFTNICLRSSIVLHKWLFAGVLRSPMKFFELNPIGRILNRFSKDVGVVDEHLPITLFDTWEIPFQTIGIFVIIAIMNPILIIPSIIVIPFFYKARNYYMKTARSLKRLESITRSPVFTHLTASFHGLATIRAMRVESEFALKFDRLQNQHSACWYLFLATSRWIAIVVDWISIFYITVVTYSFMLSDYHGSQVGLAVTSALTLTGFFQWGIRQSGECENHMVSVERILEYSELQPEPPLESAPDRKPPETWPTEGHIQFHNFFLKYGDEEPILRDIALVINPAEKIGIVGRTGAGKSSLISALFRLVEPWSGSIEIDSIDIQTLGLHDLRSKISIIPQDPVLFMGSLRRNLDPFQEFQDYELWNVLDAVNLRSSIGELTGGLDAFISEGGTNFSVGQRQLICLARAILRKNKILVLDEATANVDPETDILIQKTIREKFQDCTVLTVAHRLNTVIDSDKILVMDGGVIKEFDVAWTLLQNANGTFSQLVQQTEPTTMATLRQLANDAFLRQDNAAENLEKNNTDFNQLFL